MKKIIKNLLEALGFDVKLQINRRAKFAHVFENKLQNSREDDFNWKTYNDHYQDELLEIEQTNTLKLKEGDYTFKDGNLSKKNDILPLHTNHRLLYETIILLNPKKVIEFGCGGGDHLKNLILLAPDIGFYGCDRSIEQLNFALQRSPTLTGKTLEFDITMPLSSKLPKVDVAYTQAVIMHIKTGNGHIVGLANMFKVASKQIVLMENWTQHPFLADIQNLFDQGMIPWAKIHFYFRRAPEAGNKPHIMVVSSEPLDFEPLTSYSQLEDNV